MPSPPPTRDAVWSVRHVTPSSRRRRSTSRFTATAAMTMRPLTTMSRQIETPTITSSLRDHPDEQHPEERPQDRAGASGQLRSTDDDRGDGVELVADPDVGSAVPDCAATRSAASAAANPLKARAWTLMRFVRIPASRAARRLLPIA